GLSGICAAHYYQTAFPAGRYVVLEAREALGGTWDLFRYPGIRSDSDMYTLGFSFRPWRDPQAIADGPSILSYLQETARDEGIDEHIVYRSRVVAADWSSDDTQWTLTVEGPEGTRTVTCGFLWTATGYYRYDRGYTPEFAGRDDFEGPVVHPQHWPQDLDVDGKRIVVVGSGATAVTLVPELAKAGARVTMLQRTPTYIVALPREDAVANRLRTVLPAGLAHRLVRWKNIGWSMFYYQYCQAWPDRARRLIKAEIAKALADAPEPIDVETHFDPPYAPWDQRLCLIPEGDLFEVLASGQVELVTDTIDRFTAHGVRLDSGRELEADLVITATGLQLQFLGGAVISLDGEPVDVSEHRIYRGVMLDGIPNTAFLMGYTNASWTLKCELASRYVIRLLTHMRDQGLRRVWATPDAGAVDSRPAVDLTSGYVVRSLHELPTQGSRTPWRLHQNYVLDHFAYRFSRLDDGVLTFGE
ncbi:MAG: NAD(P)/FAD-dependent oxidoreductase, partial [Myxococcota bacterium]